jgi:hypothetical protein
MNKRVVYVSLVALMLSIYLTQFVAAEYTFPVDDMKATSQNVINYIRDLVSPILSFLLGVPDADQYFFQRTLLLALLFAIVYVVLKRVDIFRSNKPVLFIVTFVMAVLGARYMSDIKLIETALLPYGVMAIAITVFLPFIVYFYFIETSINTRAGRRAGWILFGAVFLGLWITRYKDVPEFNWIYGLGIGAIAIVFLFDGTIHRYFEMQKFSDRKHDRIAQQSIENDGEIAKFEKIYGVPLDVIIKDSSINYDVRHWARTLLERRKHFEKQLTK